MHPVGFTIEIIGGYISLTVIYSVIGLNEGAGGRSLQNFSIHLSDYTLAIPEQYNRDLKIHIASNLTLRLIAYAKQQQEYQYIYSTLFYTGITLHYAG